MNLRINAARPIEPLIGDNRGIVRMKLGNIHCMTSFSDAVRHCRPKNIRKASPALRRGLILCVAQTLAEFRSEYVAVVTGNVR